MSHLARASYHGESDQPDDNTTLTDPYTLCHPPRRIHHPLPQRPTGGDSYRPPQRTSYDPRPRPRGGNLVGLSTRRHITSSSSSSGNKNSFPLPPAAIQPPPPLSAPAVEQWGRRFPDRPPPPSNSGPPPPPPLSPLRPPRRPRKRDGAPPPSHRGSSSSNNNGNPTTVPPPSRPAPTQLYLQKSQESSLPLSSPAKLLVILDLNGTLLYRKGRSAAGSVAPSLRPGVREFLAYIFQNFKVMIWTSARPENARRMVDATFKKHEKRQLAAVWGRDTLGLTQAQYNAKVQVYKTLERVWTGRFAIHGDNDTIFNQTNTVLFDDSTEKAVGHPYNLVHIPEFLATKEQNRNDTVLNQCIDYLEHIKWQSNASAYIREHPFKYVPGQWPMQIVYDDDDEGARELSVDKDEEKEEKERTTTKVRRHRN